MTIPVATVTDARTRLSGTWESRIGLDYPVRLAPGVEARELRLSVAWDVTDTERELGRSLASQPPRTAAELRERAVAVGVRDMFPQLSDSDLARIAQEGKIPRYTSWAARIASGELAVDTLLNAAGLASFTADQKALDDRVRALIGSVDPSPERTDRAGGPIA